MRTSIAAVALAIALPAFAQELKTDDDKALYSLGYALIGKNLQSSFAPSKEEVAIIMGGLTDGAAGTKAAVDLQEFGAQPKVMALQQKRHQGIVDAQKAKGKDFAAAAEKEPGAQKDPDGGLIYIEKTPGQGDAPKPTDRVKVQYRGTLVDGTEFDSSSAHGQAPAEFPLNGVIKCWTQGLQKMKVGGKAKLVCPSDIAYGDRGQPPKIPGGATLAFDVELIAATAAPPPPTPAAPGAPTARDAGSGSFRPKGCGCNQGAEASWALAAIAWAFGRSRSRRRERGGFKNRFWRKDTVMSTFLASAALLTLALPAFAYELKTDDDKSFYSVGYSMGQNLQSSFALSPAEVEIVKRGITDGATGGNPELTAEELGNQQEIQKKIQMLSQKRRQGIVEEQKAKGKAFAAKAEKEKGAQKLPDGLIYIQIKAGKGEVPKATDRVKVQYRGTLINGTEFDSSYKRPEPAEFPLNGVVKCWTEGIQKMKVGGKAKLICPSDIAYQDRGSPPKIPGGATLVFEVELVGIAPPAPAPQMPQMPPHPGMPPPGPPGPPHPTLPPPGPPQPPQPQ